MGVFAVGLGIPTVAHAATWSVVTSPNPTPSDSLSAVARVPNTTQFWAIGSQWNAAGVSQPLIVRTTGSGWFVTASPTRPTGGGLKDVAALNTTNAWAVGYQGDPSNPQPLAEHWNGKAWQLVSIPAGSATLDGVKVFSASDVLAVGSRPTGDAIAYHWNGSAWSAATLPLPAACAGESATAKAVAAVPNSTTRFAVGACALYDTAVVWKLAGTTWSVVWTGGEVLNDITPVSAKSIWAVGSGGSTALLVHWNGKTWSSAPVPASLSDDSWLDGVITVPGTRTLWVVGGVLAEPDLPLMASYNGSAWTRIDQSPAPYDPYWGELLSVAASSASNVYAVGVDLQTNDSDGSCDQPINTCTTLIERYH